MCRGRISYKPSIHTEMDKIGRGVPSNEYIARSSPAVVTTCNGACTIVIGGLADDGGWTATVEYFQTKNRQWYKLTDLPQPLMRPSATICGDVLHVIGDRGNGSFFSVKTLPSCDIPPLTPNLISWTCLPPLPVKGSTTAAHVDSWWSE